MPCSAYPVPLILVNYEDCYTPLLEFLKSAVGHGTVGAAELRGVMLASSNDEVLDCLAEHYGIDRQAEDGSPTKRRGPVHRADSWILRDSQALPAMSGNGAETPARNSMTV